MHRAGLDSSTDTVKFICGANLSNRGVLWFTGSLYCESLWGLTHCRLMWPLEELQVLWFGLTCKCSEQRLSASNPLFPHEYP